MRTTGQPISIAEGHQRGDVGDRGPRGIREPEPVDGGPHHEFVLRVDQCVRAGLDVHAGGQKRAEVVRGDMLMVERHHIQAVREVEEGLEVFVVTHR